MITGHIFGQIEVPPL